jgi:hypothetical protein
MIRPDTPSFNAGSYCFPKARTVAPWSPRPSTQDGGEQPPTSRGRKWCCCSKRLTRNLGSLIAATTSSGLAIFGLVYKKPSVTKVGFGGLAAMVTSSLINTCTQKCLSKNEPSLMERIDLEYLSKLSLPEFISEGTEISKSLITELHSSGEEADRHKIHLLLRFLNCNYSGVENSYSNDKI